MPHHAMTFGQAIPSAMTAPTLAGAMTALSVAADFAMGQTAGFAARHWREHEALAAMRVIESAASAAPDFPQTPHAPTA